MSPAGPLNQVAPLSPSSQRLTQLGQYASSPGHRGWLLHRNLFSSPALPVAIASTHCIYPQRDGQAGLSWVAGCICIIFVNWSAITRRICSELPFCICTSRLSYNMTNLKLIFSHLFLANWLDLSTIASEAIAPPRSTNRVLLLLLLCPREYKARGLKTRS